MTKNFLCKAFRKLGAYPLIRLVDDRWSNIESVNFEGEDVAVFIGPQTPWSTFHQRPQNIAKELASSCFKVIYCIAPFDKNEPDCLIAGFKEIEPNLFLYSDITDWNVSGNVKIIYACYPWHYNQAKILKTLYPNAELIYDIFDDIDLFYKGSITIKQHKELIKLCDKVLYSADFLKPKDATSKCFYFPNAVDVGHFSNSKVLKKIGYFGAIDHWFDFKSVHEAVIENDDCVFFFAGVVAKDCEKDFQSIMAHKNVFFLGKVNYEILPGLFKDMDMGIIPFIKSKLTDSVNPIKLHEYLALGLHVISSPLHEVMKYKEFIEVYDANSSLSNVIKRRKERLEAIKNRPITESWKELVNENILEGKDEDM